MKGIAETLALPSEGIFAIRLEPGATPETARSMAGVLNQAKAKSGSRVIFLFMSSEVRMNELNDAELAAAGLQRIAKA